MNIQPIENAIQEILDDIAKPAPMNRLLEGDVGTGKTIVATIAMLNSISYPIFIRIRFIRIGA